MLTARASINIYLLLFALIVGAGCKSAEERKRDKERSSFRVHLEVNPDSTGRSSPVPIFRERPVLVNVEKVPVLDEGNIERAWVEDAPGSFVIKVQFDPSATLLFDGVTASNRGRRIAIFSQFPEPRWLGAPLIKKRISDGIVEFTPDATREEAERIVRGLNNVVKDLKKHSNLSL